MFYEKNEMVLGAECSPIQLGRKPVCEIDGNWHVFEEVQSVNGQLVLQFIELCPLVRQHLAKHYPIVYGVERFACYGGAALAFVQLYYNPALQLTSPAQRSAS